MLNFILARLCSTTELHPLNSSWYSVYNSFFADCVSRRFTKLLMNKGNCSGIFFYSSFGKEGVGEILIMNVLFDKPPFSKGEAWVVAVQDCLCGIEVISEGLEKFNRCSGRGYDKYTLVVAILVSRHYKKTRTA